MRFPILLAFLLLALPARAQVTLAGRAQTGADSREVRFEFHCSESGQNTTGALGLDLFVPRHAELAQGFDFDAFEGPTAHAGARTRIEVGGDVSDRFTVAGWAGVTEDRPFAFGLAAARQRDARRLAAVARVLRPLTVGPATLVWTQQDAGRGGPSIVARLEVSAEDSARLRRLLGPCLGR
jgi:hypothetical protein